MTVRAKPGNIEVTNPRKAGTTISYTTDHPKRYLMEENYFLECRQYLTPMDEIEVICIRDDRTWDKAKFEVVSVEQRAVIIKQMPVYWSDSPDVEDGWYHGGVQTLQDLTAKHAGFGKWDVFDEHNNKVAKNLTKEAALAMTGGAVAGKPEAEAA